ncbi:MAG: flippase-like domain-containing protein [Ardenticatenales bacterium]|nr:flippase-like domain-containing protein [Ardenticatenales bacterium]
MSRQALWTIARVVITLALLAFLLSRVEGDAVLQAMRQANTGYVLLAVLLYLGAILSNALKWGVLLRAQSVDAPWSALLRYTFVGLFFNNLLPGAVGGDLMRGYGLARYTRRGADAAVSVVVDRLIGLIALTSSAVLTVLYAQGQHLAEGTDLSGTFWIALVATALLLGGFALMISRRMRGWVGTQLERLAGRMPLLLPLVPLYTRLADAVGAYRHQPGVLVLALGIALFTWLFSNLVNYTLSLSLDPETPLSLLHIFIFNPLVGLSQLIPLSIGGLGLNQNLYDAIYHQLLEYNQAHVVAVSFLMQFVIFLTSLPGALILWFDRGKKEESSTPLPEPQS